ncbi:hypothetical protein AAC387_Pa02g4540 [Persea americana]
MKLTILGINGWARARESIFTGGTVSYTCDAGKMCNHCRPFQKAMTFLSQVLKHIHDIDFACIHHSHFERYFQGRRYSTNQLSLPEFGDNSFQIGWKHDFCLHRNNGMLATFPQFSVNGFPHVKRKG